jgi:hypothetical protein
MKRIVALVAGFLAFFSPLAAANDEVLVTHFEKRFSDWKVKTFKGKANFKIQETPQPMITLESRGTSFLLAREFRNFRMAEYPVLNFSWMVEKLPEGADLRKRSTDDQAAGLYVTLPSFPEFINFKSIGYVWETSAPLGSYDSKGVGNIKYVVLRSGTQDKMGTWVTEKRNYVEDFKKLWGINPGKRKVVISLAADSDNTKSSSRASFGKITFSKQ